MFNIRMCIRAVLLSLSVASSLAIMVTSPSEGAVWPSTGQHTVSWIEVDTDPKTFAITLVQLGVFKQILNPNVDGTAGSVTFSATLPVGDGYQVNIVKSAQEPDTILAQSPQIAITSSGSGSSSSSSSSLTPSTSTSSSPSPSSSSNGTPSSVSGSSITPSASSPASSGARNSNSVGSSSGPAATSPSVTGSATTSNSSGSGNSGTTSSLVSLEPTSSKALLCAVNKAFTYVILFISIWIIV